MTKPTDFIDRREEVKIFENMLAQNIIERVLTLIVGPEQGKTYLMRYLYGHCKEQQVASALIDFDTRRKGSIPYSKFVYEICDQVGWDNFPHVEAFEKQNYTILPLLQIQTGEGQAGIDFGSKGHFEAANLDSISGRDQIKVNVGNISYHEKQSQSAIRQKRLMDEMGRAFRSDLTQICTQNRMVILLDTYEQASLEMRKWVEEWIFDCLLDRYPNLFIIVASRPNLYDYFSQPRPWHTLMCLRTKFNPPQEEDIQKYTRIWGFNIVGTELRPFVVVANHSMATLAKLRDAYRISSYG